MSIVYEVKCGKCAEILEVVKCSLDSTDDLCIVVEACEYCLKEAKQEGIDEASE